MNSSHIVDRRLNGKNKSAVNRERFLRRYRDHIKRAVSDSIKNRSITDVDRGESISIPSKDLSEPIFSSGEGGVREAVHPGNKEFTTGDAIPKPPSGQGGGGSGQGEASNTGDGMDEFVFQISQDEFLDFMFEDLALPNLVKKQLKDTQTVKYVRAGYANEGTPSKINIVRSLKGAYARRIALTGKTKQNIADLEQELELLQQQEPKQNALIQEKEHDLMRLKRRMSSIPWIDEFDLKYNQYLKQPQPSSAAVMFCLMDVSGSMGQEHKDIAKRFYILLYLFLKRNYQTIDVVFIRHHTSAKEVEEQEFFYSRETGGTIVSSALELMHEIVQARYSPNDWNIYAAQASDGDNWNDDSPVCRELLATKLLPLVQYYSYIEITPHDHQTLWYELEKVAESNADQFAMRQITSASDIYPVFHDLFQKRPA